MLTMDLLIRRAGAVNGGKRLHKKEMMQPLVVENFMSVIRAHVIGIKVKFILRMSNEGGQRAMAGGRRAYTPGPIP